MVEPSDFYAGYVESLIIEGDRELRVRLDRPLVRQAREAGKKLETWMRQAWTFVSFDNGETETHIGYLNPGTLNGVPAIRELSQKDRDEIVWLLEKACGKPIRLSVPAQVPGTLSSASPPRRSEEPEYAPDVESGDTSE